MEKNIEQLYAEHEGKVSDKWSAYLPEYDRLFRPYRDRPVRILEIGIQNGGSLEIWSRFFPQAVQIVGCDINPECGKLQYADPRITVVVGDATAEDTFRRICALSPGFDLIIDDGSHRSGDIVRAFARYFPLLSDGGLYLAEDLHCSYWQRFEGGLFFPYASIAFFKRLADVINQQHWGNNNPRTALFTGFRAAYGAAPDEESLAHVHAVEFANSMCAVRKMAPAANAIGHRVIAGTREDVPSGHLVMHGEAHEPQSQADNPWSNSARPPEEELPLLAAQIMELVKAVEQRDQHIAALSQALAERDKR